jgi:hypothetical protein
MTPDERDDQKYTTTSARGGSRSDKYGIKAGREYDDSVRQFVKSGGVEPAAQAARRAVEGPEGPELHEAEVETARHGAMPGDPPWMAHVRELAHHAIDRVLTTVVHAEEWLKAHSVKASYHGDGRPDARR